MKKIFIFLTMVNILNATVYMGKIEPYKTIAITTEVSAKVVFTAKDKEFSYIKDKIKVLQLNTKDEEIELNSLSKGLQNLNQIYEIQKQNYQNKKRVKGLSLYDKNSEKLAFLQTKQTILDTKRAIELLKSQKEKKEFFVKNHYLGEIFIQEEEYVNIGDRLYNIYDFSKIKIVLYVKKEQLENIKEKKIFIDKKQSDFKIKTISKVTDDTRVSTYKVVLEKQNLDIQNTVFGQIVEVEFK